MRRRVTEMAEKGSQACLPARARRAVQILRTSVKRGPSVGPTLPASSVAPSIPSVPLACASQAVVHPSPPASSMPQRSARRSRIVRAATREGDAPSRSSSRVTLKLPILAAKPPSLALALPSSESERALSTVLREVVAPYFGGRIGLPPRDARNAEPCDDLDSDLLRFTVELLCDEMGGCEDEAGGGGGEVGGSGMVTLALYSLPGPF
ncbi:hypothetical protein AAT19DRAFT_16683 [Rhodotorula toruloides]|uniref:Uncharacterized protein n=1 Tax=Rhodotorula toruloides TaxID=5286 RepID=A0A2T0A422_RHOTO|nr:hypothetical protein AAT19DRAFT_16683 [Rhodotorula toruloides]